jgi:hypothetical protein
LGFSSGGFGAGGFAAGGAGAGAGLGMSTIVTMTGADAIKVARLEGRSTSATNIATCPTSETTSRRRKALLCSRLSTGT